mgnify:CR=1 FL=1
MIWSVSCVIPASAGYLALVRCDGAHLAGNTGAGAESAHDELLDERRVRLRVQGSQEEHDHLNDRHGQGIECGRVL